MFIHCLNFPESNTFRASSPPLHLFILYFFVHLLIYNTYLSISLFLCIDLKIYQKYLSIHLSNYLSIYLFSTRMTRGGLGYFFRLWANNESSDIKGKFFSSFDTFTQTFQYFSLKIIYIRKTANKTQKQIAYRSFALLTSGVIFF